MALNLMCMHSFDGHAPCHTHTHSTAPHFCVCVSFPGPIRKMLWQARGFFIFYFSQLFSPANASPSTFFVIHNVCFFFCCIFYFVKHFFNSLFYVHFCGVNCTRHHFYCAFCGRDSLGYLFVLLAFGSLPKNKKNEREGPVILAPRPSPAHWWKILFNFFFRISFFISSPTFCASAHAHT